MTAADRVQGAIDSGRAALTKVAGSKLGILGAPARDLTDATRSLTVGRPMGEVRAFWSDPVRRRSALRTGAADGPLEAPAGPGGGPTGTGPINFELPDGGRAILQLEEAPRGLGTEMRLTVHVEELIHEGRPRYGTGAAVLALRALHGAKALLETGEAPTLTANPAARDQPDPYATTGPNTESGE